MTTIAQIKAVIEGLSDTAHGEFCTDEEHDCASYRPAILDSLPDDGEIVTAEQAAFVRAWDRIEKIPPPFSAALARSHGEELWKGRWSPAVSGCNGHYVAWLIDVDEGWIDDTGYYADASGPTPTAALTALAEKLEAMG